MRLGDSGDVIEQNSIHLGVRDAQIQHGDTWIGVVESFGRHFEADAVLSALDIPECFAQCMSAIVPLQVDCTAPGFNQIINRRGNQWPILPLVISDNYFSRYLGVKYFQFKLTSIPLKSVFLKLLFCLHYLFITLKTFTCKHQFLAGFQS